MRTPRGLSRSLKSLHQTTSTSDVPFVTRRHTRVGFRIRPICCPASRSSCEGAVMRSSPASQRTLLRPAGKSRTGMSPRTPFIVSQTCKPKPAGRTLEVFKKIQRTRTDSPSFESAPPRQAELRTSSRLAPFLTTKSCDLPVRKTRDASNRCLPPKRTTCTRTSCVPGSLSPLSRRGRPTESWAPYGMTRDPDVFTTSEIASADRRTARNLMVLALRWSHERGRIGPTTLTRSSL
jgi:hypothetical protein